VEATGPDGALVGLDGSASSDPDADTLTFAWSGPAGQATGVHPTLRFPMGTTTMTLEVSDPDGVRSTDTVQITVRVMTAPAAEAGADRIVEATGPDGAVVVLDGSASIDPDGDALTFAWSGLAGQATGARPTLRFPIGTTTMTLEVSDPDGARATDTVQVTVRDTTPPALQASLTPSGQMRKRLGDFVVDYSAADLCSPSSTLAVMEMPPGAAAFAVKFSRVGREPGVSRIDLDFRKRRVVLEGADEKTLRDLLALMIADGGARVAVGQVVQLNEDTGGKGRYVFRFRGNTLLGESAGTIALRATARDAYGNTASLLIARP
jgi:PKD domain-containing protein